MAPGHTPPGPLWPGDLADVRERLARLRRDSLVTTRREAQTIFYSLAGDDASAVIETLYGLYCGIDATLTLEGEGAYNERQGFRRAGTRVVYDDDAQIVHLTSQRRYVSGNHESPCAIITITAIS